VGLDLNTPPSRLGLDIWCVKFAGLDICGWCPRLTWLLIPY
jgi:hypothetical protein